MKRDKHEFQFTGKQISEAADREAQYHRNRLQFWDQEKNVAVEAIKGAGLQVRQYEVTGGMTTQVVFDPTLQARLSQCESKIIIHKRAKDEYQIHAACYGTQPDRSYELNPDDVIYFRLAGGARED